jgi:hypothetical protein
MNLSSPFPVVVAIGLLSLAMLISIFLLQRIEVR